MVAINLTTRPPPQESCVPRGLSHPSGNAIPSRRGGADTEPHIVQSINPKSDMKSTRGRSGPLLLEWSGSGQGSWVEPHSKIHFAQFLCTTGWQSLEKFLILPTMEAERRDGGRFREVPAGGPTNFRSIRRREVGTYVWAPVRVARFSLVP